MQRGPFLVTLSEDDHAACDAIFTAPVQKFGFLQASTPQGREKAHGLLKLMRSGRQERLAKKEIMGELDAAVVDNADCRVIMDGWESVEVRAWFAIQCRDPEFSCPETSCICGPSREQVCSGRYNCRTGVGIVKACAGGCSLRRR